ncbi:branched-chain amino acid ABC transporter permease [uncultured Enterovirga sp.]|uniref:branched-chain amino acid ABC transporter permease n=1 Tax=uncultured Enterovirga sp. TaxID=2026352 RepID=UPI0035CC5DCF
MSAELAPGSAVVSASAGVRMLDIAERHRVLLAGLFLLVFPLVMPFHALAVVILTYGLYALGFNLLFGYLGLLSFGHAALFGGGAYLCGMALVHLGAPWWVGVAVGTIGGALIALIIGALAIRTRGIYFAMVTLALAQCVYYVFYQAVDLTGGENGLRLPSMAPIDLFGFRLSFVDPITRYYVVAAFVLASLFVLSRILASPFGAVIEGIRENEARARACGYDVTRSRLLAFVLSGAFCGLAGALQALHLAIVPIETLSIETSGLAVMMCLLGGMGTFFGPFIGAAVFLILENVVSVYTVHWQLVVGIVFVVCVLFFPRGIWGSILHWCGR